MPISHAPAICDRQVVRAGSNAKIASASPGLFLRPNYPRPAPKGGVLLGASMLTGVVFAWALGRVRSYFPTIEAIAVSPGTAPPYHETGIL